MSVPHHEPESSRVLQELFASQAAGAARREYPHGRIGPDDDGALVYKIATDAAHGVIRVRFPKPVMEIGMDREAAERLRDDLTERLHELRGIV
jgi:hypothetical protein